MVKPILVTYFFQSGYTSLSNSSTNWDQTGLNQLCLFRGRRKASRGLGQSIHCILGGKAKATLREWSSQQRACWALQDSPGKPCLACCLHTRDPQSLLCPQVSLATQEHLGNGNVSQNSSAYKNDLKAGIGGSVSRALIIHACRIVWIHRHKPC